MMINGYAKDKGRWKRRGCTQEGGPVSVTSSGVAAGKKKWPENMEIGSIRRELLKHFSAQFPFKGGLEASFDSMFSGHFFKPAANAAEMPPKQDLPPGYSPAASTAPHLLLSIGIIKDLRLQE